MKVTAKQKVEVEIDIFEQKNIVTQYFYREFGLKPDMEIIKGNLYEITDSRLEPKLLRENVDEDTSTLLESLKIIERY